MTIEAIVTAIPGAQGYSYCPDYFPVTPYPLYPYPDYQYWYYPNSWYWYQPSVYCPYCGKKLETHECGE